MSQGGSRETIALEPLNKMWLRPFSGGTSGCHKWKPAFLKSLKRILLLHQEWVGGASSWMPHLTQIVILFMCTTCMSDKQPRLEIAFLVNLSWAPYTLWRSFGKAYEPVSAAGRTIFLLMRRLQNVQLLFTQAPWPSNVSLLQLLRLQPQ